MSPRTKEQFENIREERKNQIIDAALEIFAHHGYHKASISQIAKEAGISKGLLYNYFENKEDLLLSVMDEGLRYLLRVYAQKSDDAPKLKLKKLITQSFDYMDEDMPHWKLYFSTMMQSDVQELVMPKMMESAMPVFEQIASVFESLNYSDPLKEARFFGTMMDGLGIGYLMDPKSFPKDFCIKRLCEFYHLNE